MSFRRLQQSLLQTIHERISNGELTERHLAKLTGVSQPHIHNVLKGVRTLSPEISDRILRELRLSVTHLCSFNAEQQRGRIPVIRDRVGPGHPFPSEIYSGTYPFIEGRYSSLVHPAVFQLAFDPAMQPELEEDDLALVDRRQAPRNEPIAGSIYLVHVGGLALMRYARLEGSILYLGTSRMRSEPGKWQRIDVEERDILEVIRGRIVWIGRQMETPAGQAAETCPPVGPVGREG